MPENKPFVVNDRRKFTVEGELRQGEPSQESSSSPASEPQESQPVGTPPDNVRSFEPASDAADMGARGVESVESAPEMATSADAEQAGAGAQDDLPPPPTAEELAQVNRAYESTVERLETAMRATNPGGERLPPMSFERFVQSLYMQALMQLGSMPEPGQPAQVDLIGARQTIEMIAILADKTKGNLTPNEQTLLDSAAFELRMGFLDVTQALARQAAATRQNAGMPGPGGMPRSSGPSIVR